MTAISSTCAPSWINPASATGPAAGPGAAAADTGGDNNGSGKVRRGHHGGGLLESLIQALQQVSGVAATNSATAAASTSSTSASASAASTPVAADGSSTLQQDMSTFLHALFSSLHAASGSASGNTAVTQGIQQYQGGGIASRVQTLLQTITDNGASTAGSSSAGLSDLNTAFQQLMQDMGGGASSGGTATPVTLQSFLQNLEQKLQANGHAQLPATGTVVNTTA